MITNSQICNTQESADIKGSGDSMDGMPVDENALFSELLDEQRTVLTELLTTLPVTSLWMLTKHGQDVDGMKVASKQDENKLQLESIRACFQDCYGAAGEQGFNSSFFKQQLWALQQAQLNTPFMGEDINVLCALVIQLASDSLQADGSQTIDASADLFPTNPKFKALFDYYQREMPGFLCPKVIVSKTFLMQLIDHHRQWSRVRQQFANHNQGLVRMLKQQYKGDVLSDDDLLQEGLIGLLKAIDRFDHRLGFKFSTYATYWIRQAMSRALTRSERTVRLPFAQMTSINKLCQARETLMNKTGREPSDQELAEELEWKVTEVSHLQNISQVALSLDETFGVEKNDNTMMRHLQQDCHESPLKQHSDLQLNQLFVQALSLLNSKERQIICWRFGFNGSNELTLEEIGKQLDLTRERVRQIQTLAMEKIKSHYGTQLIHFLA